MDDKSVPKISYADMVKSSESTNECVESISWYKIVCDAEISAISRSNSLSTILSDETENCRRSNSYPHSISHSLDSGQISDLSSDNETCSKSITKYNITCSNIPRRNQNIEMQRRRPSHSSTSTYSTDNDSISNNDHISTSLKCKLWANKDTKLERDEGILARRQKQIEYGKNTIEYQLYRKQIPRDQRTKEHPQTPDKRLKYSRRAFDGLIKIWRKKLHRFDLYDPSEPTVSSELSEVTSSEE